jgi:hypothetical protein
MKTEDSADKEPTVSFSFQYLLSFNNWMDFFSFSGDRALQTRNISHRYDFSRSEKAGGWKKACNTVLKITHSH